MTSTRRRAELLVHERHPDVRVAGHGGRDGVRVARFDRGSRAPPAAGPRTRRRDPRRGTPPPGRARLDRRWPSSSSTDEVDPHRLVDAGPLHLHHDVRAVGQLRPVHLADRRRRHRLPVEPAEHLAHRGVELLLEHLGDAVARRRRARGPATCPARPRACGEIEVGAGAEHLARASRTCRRTPRARGAGAARVGGRPSPRRRPCRPRPSDGPSPLRTAMRRDLARSGCTRRPRRRTDRDRVRDRLQPGLRRA